MSEAVRLLRVMVEQMTEVTDADGVPEVPHHACDYTLRPDTGHCQFHADWVEALRLLGYFDAEPSDD